MDGHAPANQLRLSLPGADRVKPERNLEAAKPPSAKCDPNLRPLVGSSHGTAVYGPVRTVVWEGRSREAPPYPDCPACHRGQSPRDHELDVEGTEYSPGVRRMMAVVGSETSFEQGREQLALLA